MAQPTITRIKRNYNIMTEDEISMETQQIVNIVDMYSESLEDVALRVHETVDTYVTRETEWISDPFTGVDFPVRLSDQEIMSILNGQATPIQVKDGVFFYIPPTKRISG